jgi:hypothetical protein
MTFILGFTDEDVSGCWQHWRLATEVGSAFEAEGLPVSFGVTEGPGEGRHLLHWYVSAEAARVLDRRGVGWRRFLVAECDEAPRDCHPALLASTKAEREQMEVRRHAGHH